jgi:hypothetical protein
VLLRIQNAVLSWVSLNDCFFSCFSMYVNVANFLFRLFGIISLFCFCGAECFMMLFVLCLLLHSKYFIMYSSLFCAHVGGRLGILISSSVGFLCSVYLIFSL